MGRGIRVIFIVYGIMTQHFIGKLECAHLLYGPGNRRRRNDLWPFSGRDQDPLYSGRVGALKSMVER